MVNRRKELKSVRGVSTPSSTPIPTTKHEELKDIRTSQASLSTNIHLLQRKSEALGELDPKSTKDSRIAIKNLESYNDMVDKTINQSNQIRARLINSRHTAREERHNIVVHKALYTEDSYNQYMADYEQYNNDLTESIRSLDTLTRRLGDNKNIVNNNITNIQDWTSKKGELSREHQLERKQKRQTPRGGAGYTVRWVENGEEKTATFKTQVQLDNFLKRLQKRVEKSNIRLTGTPSRVITKGPLSGLENLTWKYQTFIDLQRSRPPKDGEDKKHPWSRIGKYDTSNPEDVKNAIGWAATQTATGAVVAIPFVIGGVIGAVTIGPLGAIFIPAAMVSLTLPSVTTAEHKEKFLEYVEEHPEFYTETAFRILGGLAVAKLGSARLQRVTDGAVRRVKMSSKNYLKYLRSRPWSGQMASQQQMSWIDQLVSDMLDRVVPEYSHVPGPRTLNVGEDVSFQATKLKDYYWKVPSSGALRGEEVVTVTLKMPRIEHPLWWAVISTPGGYDKIVDSLRNRGLTDIEIDSILVSMGKSQELFVSPLFEGLSKLKPLDIGDLSLSEIRNMPILSPDLDTLQDVLTKQDVDTTQETILDETVEPVLDLELIPPIITPPPVKTPREPKEKQRQQRDRTGLEIRLRRPKVKAELPSIKTRKIKFDKPTKMFLRFEYYSKSEAFTVNATSFGEAIRKGQRIRKSKHLVPQAIEVQPR